jgi:hypothetical protein
MGGVLSLAQLPPVYLVLNHLWGRQQESIEVGIRFTHQTTTGCGLSNYVLFGRKEFGMKYRS